MFYTLQGEGAHSGRPSLFCRFSGCNLWNGLESGRGNAVCKFCDTDFVGTDGQNGGVYTSGELVRKALELWKGNSNGGFKYVVFTGGEPGLQLDEHLISLFQDHGFECAVESNGTVQLPDNLDWVCISPKSNSELTVNKGNELKLVYPQEEALPERFEHLDFEHFYLQPMDGTEREMNTIKAVEYCLIHPQWKLSLQTHKWIGID